MVLERIRDMVPGLTSSKTTVVPVVRLAGVIGLSAPFRPGLSLSIAAQPLERAFSFKSAPVVALVVNSPGGSPVQSHLIFRRIRQLAEEKDKPVVVFVEDVAASGGYMIAAAGDEIFADPSSIVGSIGVVSQGFGFTDLMEKIGVERRLYTAGENKAILDPFKPEKAEDVAHLKALQTDIHALFIDLVKERRADRLADAADLFSGLFWTGRKSVDLGLVDGLGDIKGVMTERYGEDVRLKLISTGRGGLFRRPSPSVAALSGGGLAAGSVEALAEASVAGLVAALEERAHWARFGL